MAGFREFVHQKNIILPMKPWQARFGDYGDVFFLQKSWNGTLNVVEMVTLAHFMQHPHSSKAYCPLSQHEGGSGHWKKIHLLLNGKYEDLQNAGKQILLQHEGDSGHCKTIHLALGHFWMGNVGKELFIKNCCPKTFLAQSLAPGFSILCTLWIQEILKACLFRVFEMIMIWEARSAW